MHAVYKSMKKSTILHLRIPFSFFLLPVFLFATAVSHTAIDLDFILIIVILHLLVYPASNGYNSYFDKDKSSIGGLKHPPKVTTELYWTALAIDGIALTASLFISLPFALMVLVYGLISKAYSHPSIRLKKFPFYGWLAAGFFQGYFTFLMVYLGLQDISFFELFSWAIQFPAILSSLLLFGSYPMTQVYQHDEDLSRGDMTISLKLGILGTFHFTMAFFTFAVAGFWMYFLRGDMLQEALLFQLLLLPVLLFFLRWYFQVRKNRKMADYSNTMKLNTISSVAFNLFFATWWLFF